MPWRTLLLGLALALGAWGVWWATGAMVEGWVVATALVAAVLGAIGHQWWSWVELKLPRREGTSRWWVASILFVVGTLILWNGSRVGRAGEASNRVVVTHDEGSYRLGSLMLASGRLWTASPWAADSFDTFHLLVRPVYGSIYPPGTALMHVPGVWLSKLCSAEGAGWRITPAVIGGLAVAAVYLLLLRVGTESNGGGMAIVGAVMLLGAPQFRVHGGMVMSQVPSLLLGTLALWMTLGWRERPGKWRAVLIGALAGWLVIVRPQDAAFVLPVVGMMTVGLLRRNWRQWTRHAALAVAAAAPFLSLQIIQNVGMTGSPFRTAYWTYTQTMQPGTGFLSGNSLQNPQSMLQQKRDYNATFGGAQQAFWNEPLYLGVIRSRIGVLLDAGFPTVALGALIPLGLVGMWRRPSGHAGECGGRYLLAVLGLYVLIYGTFTFYLTQYVLPISGILAGLIAFAPVGVGAILSRGETVARASLATVVLALTLAHMPEINHRFRDPYPDPADSRAVSAIEASLNVKPAVLLVRYSTGNNYHDEPVYNLDHYQIEANTVIRAHDLGEEQNRKLLAGLPEPRMVYLFDRRSRRLMVLGKSDELLKQTERKPEGTNQ